jgi:putative membrane protein
MKTFERLGKIVRNFLNGVAFGITETIPGVSGGTVAIILGFYFPTIEAINHFRKNVRKHLLFLGLLALGAACGIVLFSSLINFLLTHYSFPTMAFFIGLIMGIIPHIFSQVKKDGFRFRPHETACVLLPLLAVVLVSIAKAPLKTPPEVLLQRIDVPFMLFIFAAGIVAAAALVIPGVSGSFVLLLLGIYPLVIFAVSLLRVFLANTADIALFVTICKVLAPLALGVIIGGLSMVRLIEGLLKKHHKIVYSIILGLLSGSVIVLFKSPIMYASGISALAVAIGAATLALGAFLSFAAGKKQL